MAIVKGCDEGAGFATDLPLPLELAVGEGAGVGGEVMEREIGAVAVRYEASLRRTKEV